MRSVDEIWAGDLFGRKAEAGQLIGYLETVGMRPSLREDHAFVLAVDAPYGEGKSYFLRRFAEHMAGSHPVAFVDAWTDDLEDEPLVALAATLETALAGLEDQSGELRRKINNMVEKTGEVAKIAFAGLAKRGLGLLITDHAVQGIEDVVHKVSDDVKDAISEGVEDVIDEAVEEVTKIATPSMKKRIDTFRDGQRAVAAMKASLRELVAYLKEGKTYPPPIVIVIDELDRCRPTYALKLLEEVKHLFDVSGLVFVLGMNGQALGHSVAGAYGINFDGSAYLQRFITRRYNLATPSLASLVREIFSRRQIDARRLDVLSYRTLPSGNEQSDDPLAVIALSLKSYGMTARHAFAVVDMLETCLALTGNLSLSLSYLLPLICNQVRGLPGPAVAEEPMNWTYVAYDREVKDNRDVGPDALFRQIDAALVMPSDKFREAMRADNGFNLGVDILSQFRRPNFPTGSLAYPGNYPRLLETVTRFETPSSMPT